MKLNEARRYDYSIKDTLLNMPKRPDKKKKLINYRISVERTLRENKNNITQLQVTKSIKRKVSALQEKQRIKTNKVCLP